MNGFDPSAARAALIGFFGSKRFEVSITVIIAFNALLLAAETVPSVEARFGGLIGFLNNLILLVFVVEIGLKIAVMGRGFWLDPWSWFDMAVVLVSITPTSESFGALRAFRALRLLRLVIVVPSLRRVVEGLLKAIPSLSSIMVLMVLLLFVFAIMGTRMFGEAHPEFFGSLGASAFSLFTVMTLEGWPDLARDIMKTHPSAWMFFIVFIMLSSWAVLNLVIGVIVDSMQSHARENEEELETTILRDQAIMMAEIRLLRKELAELRRAVDRSEAGHPDN
jgi:voltage-gated sodium channel